MSPGGDKDVSTTRINLFQSVLASPSPALTEIYDTVETKTRNDCMSSQPACGGGGGEEGVIVRGLTFRQVLSRDDRSEGTIIRAVCLGVVPASDYRIQNSVTLSTDCRNSCAAVRSLNPSQTSDYQK